MAKVMISLPDDLLAWIDKTAADKASTRSAVLREFAQEVRNSADRRHLELMRELDGHAQPRQGDVVDLLKSGRPTWPY